MANFKNVAVIGGGISGLSTLYYLIDRINKTGQSLSITLYESKNALGGNAETVTVDLGLLVQGQTATPYQRWADLGVNDMNLTAYPDTEALMRTVGYLDNLKPLQNTECYWSDDGQVALTDDTDLNYGVSDPAFNLGYVDGGKFSQLIKVVHQTGLDAVQNPSLPTSYTVGNFFSDCISQPQSLLSAAADKLGIRIDWQDPALKQRLSNIRDWIYYPRISAMYFTDDRGPDLMPLAAPFNYYRIQEGGSQQPQRRYFNGGAQKWLEMLAAYIRTQMVSSQVRVTINRNNPVTAVNLSVNRVSVQTAQGSSDYDLCIMATHADDALKVLNFGGDLAPQADFLKKTLLKVRYTQSYAVCHTYAGCMPHNKNNWRTYNVPLRSASQSKAYNIHYVVNLHQNDHNTPAYDHAGLPLYFVSLVDNLQAIPPQSILNRVDTLETLPEEVRSVLPKATLQRMQNTALHSGYTHQLEEVPEGLQDKAWTMFKHNVLDANCMQAQNDLQNYHVDVGRIIASGQLPACRLLFAGGWTHGAGLHEQCLQQSQQISQWLVP